MDIKKIKINSVIKKINKLILKYGKQEILNEISHTFGLNHHHHDWNTEHCCNDNKTYDELIQKKHLELNHSDDKDENNNKVIDL